MDLPKNPGFSQLVKAVRWLLANIPDEVSDDSEKWEALEAALKALEAKIKTLVGTDGKPVAGNPHKTTVDDMVYKSHVKEWTYDAGVCRVKGRSVRIGPLIFLHGTLEQIDTGGFTGTTPVYFTGGGPGAFPDANYFGFAAKLSGSVSGVSVTSLGQAAMGIAHTNMQKGDIIQWQAWGFAVLPANIPNAPA